MTLTQLGDWVLAAVWCGGAWLLGFGLVYLILKAWRSRR